MSISALSPMVHAQPFTHAPEATEGSGPDKDGDSDDRSTSATSSVVSSSVPSTMGKSVDTKA